MKRWTEPKLFVLTRGRPEEAVLLVCKTHGGTYSTTDSTECGWKDGEEGVCRGVTGT